MNTAIQNGQHYINGEWIRGSGKNFYSVNPMDNSIIWQGKAATEKEISKTLVAARKAFKYWSLMPIEKRGSYLENFVHLVEKYKQELITLISKETGKPLWESTTEVQSVIAKLAISLQAYQERTGAKQFSQANGFANLRFKPHGVVAVLGAFNFPAHLSNGHIIPALIAGNTVIYKPSELSPAVAEFIMQCWHESGIPNGVISCVQGLADTGKKLLESDIQAVYFTGSYKVGQAIHASFSKKPEIILALEMGGSNPLVVDKVEDIDAAVYCTILSSLLTAGQRCSCARRIIIKNDRQGSEFLESLISACKRLKRGSYLDKPEPFMGPVIRESHALSHLQAQENLKKLGGKILLAMQQEKENSGLLSPGIIDMTSVKNVPDEEIFAPFMQIYRYQTFEEAIALANKTRYGLCAGLLSDKMENYQLFYKKIRAGLINWNRPTTGALSSLPFGGVGCSGNHRPSAYFAADYCAYPVTSLEQSLLTKPAEFLPGIILG